MSKKSWLFWRQKKMNCLKMFAALKLNWNGKFENDFKLYHCRLRGILLQLVKSVICFKEVYSQRTLGYLTPSFSWANQKLKTRLRCYSTEIFNPKYSTHFLTCPASLSFPIYSTPWTSTLVNIL